ncbi:uncharacterized protein LOC134805937 [Cydia splendana]|uniref:uncharacterized protein LOC134805937 n=1 Tax=Cydia splendana TaxID=1100963 RepID=UPI00300D3D14
MPFKIVQTLERGGYRLTVVPSLWESNNILRWPPKSKNILRVIKDESSKPGTDWEKMKCNVKRRQLSSYAQAEMELEIMERQSETDVNELQHDQTLSHSNIQAHQELDTFDFNAYADTLANTNSSPKNVNNTNTHTGEVILQVCGDQNNLTEKMDTIINMIHNQNQIIENMANKICVMSVQIEDITEKLSRHEHQPMNMEVTLLKNTKNLPENESYSFAIIENQQQLDALEVKLADKAEYKKLKRHLSFLCTPTVGEGKNFAYRLMDSMLSRDFVPLCSWSGGSRGDVSKIALKDYKMFKKFFFELIHSWDSAFTIESTESFFKVALKNSTKRKSMKNLRASRTKRRRKNTAKKGIEPIIAKRQGEDTSNIEQEQNKRNNEAMETINITQKQDQNKRNNEEDEAMETINITQEQEQNKRNNEEVMR